MANHHKINILFNDGSVRAEKSEAIRVGDTVTYASDGGKVRIVFPNGSPYKVNEVHNMRDHVVQHAGSFEFHCFITPHGETQEVGWSPEHPRGGRLPRDYSLINARCARAAGT